MTFRPSVLPDRDNDIISTFTRSFERARNLVRQDQADTRARTAFQQETRLRGQQIEDLEFQAAVRSGQPGTFRTGAFPTGAEITEPIGEALGEAEAPETVTGAGGVGVITEPEPRPEGERPEDAVDIGGGRMFSQSLADQIERAQEEADIRREADIREDLPAARRERRGEQLDIAEETRERREEASERRGEAAAFRNLFPSLTDEMDDDTVIAQGKILAQEQLRRTPTGASIVSAADRVDRGTANVLAVFERKLAAARSAAGRVDPTPQQRLDALQSGEPFDPAADIDPASIMEETITDALTAGTITPDQAATMQANVAGLLEQADQGEGGPLSDEDLSSFLEASGGGTIEQQAVRWRSFGLDEEEIAQLTAAAGGR